MLFQTFLALFSAVYASPEQALFDSALAFMEATNPTDICGVSGIAFVRALQAGKSRDEADKIATDVYRYDSLSQKLYKKSILMFFNF